MSTGIFVSLTIVNIILIGAFSHLLHLTRKNAKDEDFQKLKTDKKYRWFIVGLLILTVLATLGSMVGIAYHTRSDVKNVLQPSVNRAVKTYKNIDTRATNAYNAAMNHPGNRPVQSVEMAVNASHLRKPQ